MLRVAGRIRPPGQLGVSSVLNWVSAFMLEGPPSLIKDHSRCGRGIAPTSPPAASCIASSLGGDAQGDWCVCWRLSELERSSAADSLATRERTRQHPCVEQCETAGGGAISAAPMYDVHRA